MHINGPPRGCGCGRVGSSQCVQHQEYLLATMPHSAPTVIGYRKCRVHSPLCPEVLSVLWRHPPDRVIPVMSYTRPVMSYSDRALIWRVRAGVWGPHRPATPSLTSVVRRRLRRVQTTQSLLGCLQKRQDKINLTVSDRSRMPAHRHTCNNEKAN